MTVTAPGPQVGLPYGPHHRSLRDVVGVHVVESPTCREIRVRTAETSHLRSLMGVVGPVGVGKSFMIARACEACMVDARRPVNIVWIDITPGTRGKSLLVALHIQIAGRQPTRNMPARELMADLRAVLADSPRLLVLDEIQNVSSDALLILRWLLDQPDGDFGIVWAGLPGVLAKLPRELVSRTQTWVKVRPLADADVAAVLAAYHPLFVRADPGLLRRANRTDARGEFRWWAMFLARAVPYAAQLGVQTVDRHLYDTVLEAMTR